MLSYSLRSYEPWASFIAIFFLQSMPTHEIFLLNRNIYFFFSFLLPHVPQHNRRNCQMRFVSAMMFQHNFCGQICCWFLKLDDIIVPTQIFEWGIVSLCFYSKAGFTEPFRCIQNCAHLYKLTAFSCQINKYINKYYWFLVLPCPPPSAATPGA